MWDLLKWLMLPERRIWVDCGRGLQYKRAKKTGREAVSGLFLIPLLRVAKVWVSCLIWRYEHCLKCFTGKDSVWYSGQTCKLTERVYQKAWDLIDCGLRHNPSFQLTDKQASTRQLTNYVLEMKEGEEIKNWNLNTHSHTLTAVGFSSRVYGRSRWQQVPKKKSQFMKRLHFIPYWYVRTMWQLNLFVLRGR